MQQLIGRALAHPEDWMEEARCRGADPSIFFPVGSKKRLPAEARRAAREFCGACPVQEECLDYAIRNKEEDGIWGSQTPDQRKIHRAVNRRNTRE